MTLCRATAIFFNGLEKSSTSFLIPNAGVCENKVENMQTMLSGKRSESKVERENKEVCIVYSAQGDSDR